MKQNSGHGVVLLLAIAMLTTVVAVVGKYSEIEEANPAEPSTGVIVEMAKPDTPSEPEQKIPEPAAEPAIELVSIGYFRLTAYCPCSSCCGEWAYNRPTDAHGNEIVYTATGEIAEAGRTIAVDPDVIAYGTEVIINGRVYEATDCGGAIQENRIDVYMDDHKKALEFGVQYATVYVKEDRNERE